MIREKLEFPEHEVFNNEASQLHDEFKSDLGSMALKGELEVLESQIEQENSAADEEFLHAYNNRRWWRTQTPHKDEVQGWSKGRYGTSNSHFAETRAHGSQNDEWYKERNAVSDTKARLAGIRQLIGELSASEIERMDQNLDSRLQEYAKNTNNDYDNLAFVQWKKQEATTGDSLSWTDWLKRPTDRDSEDFTTEERQMLNFLQWNQHHYNAVNSDPAVRKDLDNRARQFSDDLEVLTKKGVLDPKIQSNNLSRPMRVTIGEPIDVGLLSAYGYAETDRPNIVLRPGFKEGTYVHERVHPLGSLGDRYWNEAATQYIADEVNILHKKDLHDSAYESSIKVLENILRLAAMNTREFSAYFASEDYDGFMQQINKRTGLDVDGAYQAIKQRAHELYAGNNTMFNLYIELHMEDALKTVIGARKIPKP